MRHRGNKSPNYRPRSRPVQGSQSILATSFKQHLSCITCQASKFLCEMDHDEIVRDPLLRSVLDSAERARQQCLEITQLLEQHKTAPAKAPRDVRLELSKHQKRLFTHLAQVRSLNRDALYGVRTTKAVTTDARHEIDTLHLQLQNLYYEQRHLIGEIDACQSYE